MPQVNTIIHGVREEMFPLLLQEVLPFLAMASMECLNVGLQTLFKAAATRGMSHHVFLVYSYAVASLVLLPSPFFSSRSRTLPPLGTTVLSKMGLAALIGNQSQFSDVGISNWQPYAGCRIHTHRSIWVNTLSFAQNSSDIPAGFYSD